MCSFPRTPFADHEYTIENGSRKKAAADERVGCVTRRSSAAVCFLVEDFDNKLPSGQLVRVGRVNPDVAEAGPPWHAREEIGFVRITPPRDFDRRHQLRVSAGVDVVTKEHPVLDVV